jgi:hypothetical protein
MPCACAHIPCLPAYLPPSLPVVSHPPPPPGPLLDELAAGLVECRAKRLVGPALQLDHFLDAMLRRWVGWGWGGQGSVGGQGVACWGRGAW